MADLGNLWFSLGLDDKRFEKEWKAAFNKYKNDAQIKVDFKIDSNAIKELNKFKDAGFTAKEAKEYSNLAASVMKVAREQEKYNRELAKTKALQDESNRQDAESLKRQALTQERINNYINKRAEVTQGYKTQSLWLQNLSTLASNYFSLYAVKNFVTELATVSGEFEKQRVTLQAMVGEMEGLEIYGKMKELAIVSPFELKDLASYAKQLAAFSVPYEELYDTTKRLADVSAGLGVDMSRIILAYGQIRSAGVLKGTELRQLTEAGVPILEKLADKFEQLEGKAVSVGDVFGKISQKLVPFEMVKDIFAEMTSEGGKFYNMQEIQAETLAGKIANLKDAYAIMLSEIGEGNEGALKDSAEWLYKLIDNWETVGRVVVSVFAAYSALQGVKILYWIREQIQGFKQLIATIRELRVEHGLLQAITKGGGWGAIAFAFVGIGTAIWQAWEASRKFRDELESIIGEGTTKINQETRALEELRDALDKSTEGSQNRRDAINQFNNQFGSYLHNMLTEKSTAEELAMAYNNVTAAIKDKNKQEAKTKVESLIEDEYGSRLNTTIGKLMSGLKERGLTSKEAQDIIALLREYYKTGGAKVAEINKIIKDRIGEDAFKEADLNISNAFNSKLKTTLRQQVLALENALKAGYAEIDARYDDSAYSTKGEADLHERVNKLYEKRVADLRNLNLEQGEFNKRLKEIDFLKLQELSEGYDALGLHKIAESYLKQADKLKGVTAGWRAEIQKLVTEAKQPITLAVKDDESFVSYVDRLRELYKELTENIKKYNGVDTDGLLGPMKEQLKVVGQIAEKYHIALDPKGDRKSATDAEKDRVNTLKEEYQWVLKVYDAYKNYREQGLTDKEAKVNVSADFQDSPAFVKAFLDSSKDASIWFKTIMDLMSREAAQGGSDIGNALATAIMQKLGVIVSKEGIAALKLGEQIQNELSKWGLEDFNLSGTGVTYDISKILNEQSNADNQAFEKRKDLLDKIAKAEAGNEAQIALLKKEYGENWLKEAKDRANKLYEDEIAYNKNVAQEKINELGKAYAKEMIEDNIGMGVMDNLSEKSYSELLALQSQLDNLIAQDPEISDALKKKLEEEEISLEDFIKKYKEYLALQAKEVKSATGKELKENLFKAADVAIGLVDTLRELSDSNFMSGFLDSLGLGLNVSKDIVNAFSEENKNEDGSMSFNGYVALAQAAMKVTQAVTQQIAAAKQYREEMQRAADSFSRSLVEANRELSISGEKFDTIFGEDAINALNADSKAISQISQQLRYASDEVSNMKIMTKKGIFGIGRKYTTLKDLAPQLFKADGSVNYEYLDEFLDAYGDKMGASQKELLEHLQATYEQYQDAMSDTTDYLTGIFSDTASTIADRMIEAFALTGDAATGLGDLVSGVAKTMAKDLIQSLLIDQYLTPAMDRIKALYNPNSKQFEQDSVLRTQKAILAMQDAINAATESVPEVNKLLEAIQAMGIDLNADAENASEVLSGLTEDQQNLLVAYINGIRADVSTNKGLLLSVVNSVGAIDNNIATAIVVWKQIEANTHRSADGVDRIIGFFESVMGPYDGGGGQAFRVNVA